MLLTPLPPLDIRSRAGQYTERTAGLHVSQIIGDLLVSMDPDTYGKNDANEGKWMNFLAGLVFERALELAWLDKEIEDNHRPELVRPGEVERDGILGTPDAFDTRLGRPEEYKCTKKSCRQEITDPKFWHYFVQLKAYVYMLGCNSGVLWVLFVNGNYSNDDNDPESSYVIKGWEMEWTDLELEENWTMLVNHARLRGWLK